MFFSVMVRLCTVVGNLGTDIHLPTGASLRKQVKKMEITQHATYTCSFCGKVSIVSYCTQGEVLFCTFIKDSVRREAVGIWHCRACRKTVAGGAWVVVSFSVMESRRLCSHQLAGYDRSSHCAIVCLLLLCRNSLKLTICPRTIRRLRELTEA